MRPKKSEAPRWGQAFWMMPTSPEVVAPLTRALMAIAATPEYRDKLAVYGVAPKPATPQELSAILSDEYKQFALLVKASGYVPE